MLQGAHTLVRPLRAWTASQHATAAAALELAWRSWQQAWLPRSATSESAFASEACEAARNGWMLLGREADRCAWTRLDGVPLEHRLFGASEVGVRSQLALAAVQRARAALHSTLASAAGIPSCVDESLPPDDLFIRWRGATVVHLPGEISCDVLLNAECMDGLAGPRARGMPPGRREPVSALAQALGDHRLTLSIEISQCDLSLGELEGLKVGDVVTFAHDLDEPLHVTAAGKAIFAGWLGRVGSAKAVELLSSAAIPSISPQE